MIDNDIIIENYDASAAVMARADGRDRKLIAKVWESWRPPMKITPTEWAVKYRTMSEGVTSEPGKYNGDRIPWQRYVQDAVINPLYAMHVWCGASQVTTKTEMLNNVVGYFSHADPSSMMIAYPTKESADSWSKDKFTPMVNDTPVLRELYGDPRSRDSGNTISHKKFKGGSLTVVGKNSPSKLRQRSVRVTIEDEVDSDKSTTGVEGDSSSLLRKRSESFSNAVHIMSSTPTIAGASRIWEALEASNWTVWSCPCHACGEFQELKWSQVKWDSEKNAAGQTIKHHPETARYACEHCGTDWNDTQRQRAIMQGRPMEKRPENAKVFGFHQNGLYKLIGAKRQFSSMLEEFVVGFLEAKKGGPEKVKVWTNTFLAEPYEEKFEVVDEKAVIARAEDYDPATLLPDGVLRISGAADVQGDRIEAELIGWGEDEETWGLGYAIFHGDTNTDAPWDELDAFIARTFLHPCGQKLTAQSFFVDSGTKQDRVFEFTGPRRARGIFACKGKNIPGRQVPILEKKPSTNNKRKVPQWMVGITSAKTVTYDRLMLPVPGPRSVHFPKGHGYDERFYRQLTAEKRKTRYTHGRPYFIYESGGARNEPLDIRVYALAAHRRLFFDAAQIRQQLGIDGPATVADADGGGATDSAATRPNQPHPGSLAALTEPAPAPSQLAKSPPPLTSPAKYIPISQRRRMAGIHPGGSAPGEVLFKA